MMQIAVNSYLMKIDFEWPNSTDNIAFEHQEQFGQIEYGVSLRYSIANKMENMIQYGCPRKLRRKRQF